MEGNEEREFCGCGRVAYRLASRLIRVNDAVCSAYPLDAEALQGRIVSAGALQTRSAKGRIAAHPGGTAGAGPGAQEPGTGEGERGRRPDRTRSACRPARRPCRALERGGSGAGVAAFLVAASADGAASLLD